MIKPYYEDTKNGLTIYCGDCLEVMREMEDKSVDLVLTDPPYGMNFQSNHRAIKYEKIEGDNRYPVEIIDEFIRLSNRAIYLFCRWNNLTELPKPKSCLVWVKNNWSMGDLKHEHGRQWEAICYYPQENHEFIKRIPDVIICKRTENVYHPTQKPVGIIRKIIESNKGNLILDPFLGSGTTLVACKELGRRGIGIEISEKYCEIAVKRLKNTQTSMF